MAMLKKGRRFANNHRKRDKGEMRWGTDTRLWDGTREEQTSTGFGLFRYQEKSSPNL